MNNQKISIKTIKQLKSWNDWLKKEANKIKFHPNRVQNIVLLYKELGKTPGLPNLVKKRYVALHEEMKTLAKQIDNILDKNDETNIS